MKLLHTTIMEGRAIEMTAPHLPSHVTEGDHNAIELGEWEVGLEGKQLMEG